MKQMERIVQIQLHQRQAHSVWQRQGIVQIQRMSSFHPRQRASASLKQLQPIAIGPGKKRRKKQKQNAIGPGLDWPAILSGLFLHRPTVCPTARPFVRPSDRPSDREADRPSNCTTVRPTGHPTIFQSVRPCVQPSVRPSVRPSVEMSAQPSDRPSDRSTARPTRKLFTLT